MKKNLRFAMMAALAMFSGSMFAQATVWEEDWQSSEAGKLVSEVTNANATYTLNSSNDNPFCKLYTNQNDPNNLELLLPQTSRGESFTANINLRGNTGNMTLSYSYNKNQIEVTTTTAGVTISDVSKTGAKISVPAGTSTLALTFNNPMSQNGRLDNLKLVTDDGSGQGGDDPDPGVTKVSNIAAFKALTADTEAQLTLTNAQVLYAQGNDIFVRDNTGAIDFYSTGIEANTGDMVNGTIIGKYTIFKSMPELAKGDKFQNNLTFSAAPAAPDPVVLGVDEININYACDLITIENLKVVKDGNNTYGVSPDDDRIQIYDKFRINYQAVEGETYTITGILIPYNDIFEIAPISDFTNSAEKEDAGLAWSAPNFTATIDKDNVFPTLSNPNYLTVTYRSTNTDVATIDEYGAITLLTPGQTTIFAESAATSTYKAGSASYILYVEKEAVEVSGEYTLVTSASDLKAGDMVIIANVPTEEYDALAISVTQNSNNRAAAEITLEDNVATITDQVAIIKLAGSAADGWNFYVTNGPKTGYLTAVKGKSNYLRTVEEVTPEATATISIDDENGAIITFGGETERNIIRFNPNTKNGAPLFSCYATDSSVQNPVNIYKNGDAQATAIREVSTQQNAANIYNLAGQRVQNATKGIFIQNGKKFIVK